MGRLKVLLADNKEIFREGLARLLDEEEHIEVVCQCCNGEQAIEKVKEIEPDVVLMDSKISECGSLEATRNINESSPRIKVAMLTESQNEDILFSAIEAGATGYLAKDMKLGHLVKSIDLIAEGEVVVSPPLGGKLLTEFSSLRKRREASNVEGEGNLSERETEIIRLVVNGATNKDIAERLVIAENTVKVHIKNILEKWHLRNKQQAAAYAVQQGLVTEVEHGGEKPANR